MLLKKKYIIAVTTILFLLCFSYFTEMQAQCPMCKMSAESNLKNGGTAGAGLNNGILFMLATPYILVGLIGFIWWRNRKKQSEEEQSAAEY